jgi:hypothetical protein
MPAQHSRFLDQISELIRANGWEGQLKLELLAENESAAHVRVRLSQNHPVAPLAIVNEYMEGTHPLEQVQQECLRALRTGSPGI